MQTYAILRRSGWGSTDELRESVELSRQVGEEEMPDRVRWLRSYALAEEDGSLGTVCVYEATDPEAIWEHASRAELPIDEIIPIADTVVIRPDPEPAAS